MVRLGLPVTAQLEVLRRILARKQKKLLEYGEKRGGAARIAPHLHNHHPKANPGGSHQGGEGVCCFPEEEGPQQPGLQEVAPKEGRGGQTEGGTSGNAD